MPVKLYDYLSFGRPLIVTDCFEQARLVRESGAGIVVADEPEAMADGILRVAGATGAELDAWGTASHAAARASSWEDRARTIVTILAAA